MPTPSPPPPQQQGCTASPPAAERGAARILSPAAPRTVQPVRTLAWHPHASQTNAPPPVTQIFVDLPTITVTADPSGALTLGPVALGNAADLGISPALLAHVAAANVQHIQMTSGGAGVAVEANNQPILGLAWDAESLGQAASLLAQAEQIPPLFAKAAPLLTLINLDLIADLSQAAQQADHPAIPIDATVSQADVAALAAAAGQEAVRLELPIRYGSDGIPQVLGLASFQIEALTGTSLAVAKLSPQQLALLKQAGIAKIALSTQPDGLHLSVNDTALPTFLWAQGEITHLASLIAPFLQAETGQTEDGADMMAGILATIDQYVTLIQSVDMNVSIQFPE